MKNKKIVLGIITIISTILVVCLIGFSPNIVNRLRGNANSFENNNGTAVKTGVVIDTVLTYKQDTNSMPIKIYNGSNKSITINSIIWRNLCLIDKCEDFKEIKLTTPIAIDPDSDYEYQLNDVSDIIATSNVDVGVQYVLDGKTYNLASKSFKVTDFSAYTLNKNSADDIPEEFTIIRNKSEFDSNMKEKYEGFADIKIKLSDTDVKMDLSENLDKLGITYQFKAESTTSSESKPEVKLANPLYDPETAYPRNNLFGKRSPANVCSFIKCGTNSEYNEYFIPYFTITDDYNDTQKIILKGSPKKVVSNETVILKLSFEQDAKFDKNGTSIYSELAYFTSEKIPQFKLTVYDKSNLATAIQNGIAKMQQLSEETASIKSVKEYSDLIYNEGVKIYENRDVTQAEINSVTNRINNFKIIPNSQANYTNLDKIKSDIGALNRSYYKEGSFTEIDELLKKYEDNLSENYQVKIDNLTKKLTEKYNALEMLDADYSRVEDAIKTSELLTNKTSDGKNLYTNESWNKLQEAIKAVVYGKKINEQELVNQYAVNISKAMAELEYAPADYSKLNVLIDDYELNKEYYLEESKVEFEEYLKNVTYDKNITEQNKVDKWYEDLSKLAESLELRKALGYYDSDNYDFIKQMGYMSFEGYERYFKGLQKEYYTDESVEMIDMVLEAFDDPELRGYTIAEQAAFDQVLFWLQTIVDMLKKKPGNFDELCKYYSEALNLNTSYYEDLTKLNDALSNVDFNLKMDEQDKIDETTKALKDAINNLVLKDADYTLFNEAYNKATSLNPRHYVDFSAVEEAITEANANKNLKIDKQSKVDEVTEKLKKAMSKLVLRDADYSKIEALKAIINDIDSSKYTNFNVVEEALNDIVYGKKANEQDLVDEMYNKLKKAYDSLQKTKADYSELNKVVEKANKYESQKDNYENYQDLKKLLDGIDYDLTWDKQSVVDDYVDKINDAINSLRKKSADYTELQEQLSKIPSDYSNLDRNLQNEIESLLNEARNLPNDLTYDEQSRIDDLVVKFKDLINRIPKDNSLENVQGNVQGGIKDNTQGNSSNGVVSNQVVLSYLRVNGNNVDIRTLPFRYSVGYNVTSANIEVGLSSKKSVSKVYGGKVLLPGDNNITIIVTTSNGKTYTYTLIITRSNASDYLSDLKIKQYDINFVKTKQEYTIKIGKNIEKLDLSVKAEDKNAKVNIKGNNNLKNGSKVYVEVKSQDGRVRVYTINIQKSGYVDLKVIAIIIMILIIILGVIKYIQEKRKYNQKDSE